MKLSNLFVAAALVIGAFQAQAMNACISNAQGALVDIATTDSEIVLTAEKPVGFAELAAALDLISYIHLPGIASNIQTLLDAAKAQGLDKAGSFQTGDTVSVTLDGGVATIVFTYGSGANEASADLTAPFFTDVLSVLTEADIPGIVRGQSCN